MAMSRMQGSLRGPLDGSAKAISEYEILAGERRRMIREQKELLKAVLLAETGAEVDLAQPVQPGQPGAESGAVAPPAAGERPPEIAFIAGPDGDSAVDGPSDAAAEDHADGGSNDAERAESSAHAAAPDPEARSEPAVEAASVPQADKADAPVPQGSKPSKPYWIFCCGQWQGCVCGGRVRWGMGDKWKTIEKPKGKFMHEVKCNIDVHGDPFPGADGKHCLCEITPGSDFAEAVNPALLPSTDARVASSCESFRDGAGRGDDGAAQWKAVEAFCSPDWASSEEGKAAKAGNRAMPLKMMQSLMLSWVDRRFEGNYDRYFGGSGWVDYAFINYYAGPPDGKHAYMTEELIRSVHEFSEKPIVVYHFGVVTPDRWTQDKFPRLILIHSKPMDPSVGRSFNFNKLRAMILSRIRVGVQLDSDQFVAPGVDAMFKTTEREITKDYPMPILPAHFLDRTPRDTGSYWKRYCPQNKCQYQSARWGHAHPTWTYWALPWLGRWLRRNFRDEVLVSKEGGSMSELRVVDIPEDEDLLNVGTWEDGGKKQWCKIDLPGPSDFMALLRVAGNSKTKCSMDCGDIDRDKRFHPDGVAKVFYTAHHAVDPQETRHYIKMLAEKKQAGNLPPPIMYHGKFYEDGEKLKAAHPEITCII